MLRWEDDIGVTYYITEIDSLVHYRHQVTPYTSLPFVSMAEKLFAINFKPCRKYKRRGLSL